VTTTTTTVFRHWRRSATNAIAEEDIPDNNVSS
jgi:hypothetical protein